MTSTVNQFSLTIIIMRLELLGHIME